MRVRVPPGGPFFLTFYENNFHKYIIQLTMNRKSSYVITIQEFDTDIALQQYDFEQLEKMNISSQLAQNRKKISFKENSQIKLLQSIEKYNIYNFICFSLKDIIFLLKSIEIPNSELDFIEKQLQNELPVESKIVYSQILKNSKNKYFYIAISR
ncbi:MAG: hypothetical protein NZZ41_04710 [Candidatus Dojkabacteria bacterium]|nr:hypothetical protein [Candidatus Dojkabacteria bacterium]